MLICISLQSIFVYKRSSTFPCVIRRASSVDSCCGVKWCPQLFLSVPHYFGVLDFSELHGSSLGPTPRTAGILLQTTL